MTAMTYEEALGFARLDSFRQILPQEDGSYAVVLTCLMWVSANLETRARTCTTATQVISQDSANTRLIREFDLSRHSIKRRAAAEGVRKLAHHKARYADRHAAGLRHDRSPTSVVLAVSP